MHRFPKPAVSSNSPRCLGLIAALIESQAHSLRYGTHDGCQGEHVPT